MPSNDSQWAKQLEIWLRRILLALWIVVIAVVLFLNARLYVPSPLAQTASQIPDGSIQQLNAHREALEAGSASSMQDFFPEGYYFSYLFHGLSWVEVGLRDEAYAERAIAESIWCFDHLDSAEGRAPFPKDLPPDHGMFYSAWKCVLCVGIVRLQKGEDKVWSDRLRKECDDIAAALKKSKTPFLASYWGSSWPCDTVPAIYALSVYDQLFEGDRYGEVIATWLADANERLDPETGLLPHTTDSVNGSPGGVARATSQVIILRLLPDIDAVFARQQYTIFRKRFLTTFLGLPCVREYPSGVEGTGDIDSGPLIFGRSLSATALMTGVAQVYGDQSLADAIAQTGETVGMPWTRNDRKRYAFGALPLGDTMVTYSYLAQHGFADSDNSVEPSPSVGFFWRAPVHALSLLVFLPALRIFMYRRRRRTSS